MKKKIFILTGEASGDKLASKVISELNKLNSNVKYLSVGGENLEKLEYIGYSLEKFYETKKATFYLFDYEGITKI